MIKVGIFQHVFDRNGLSHTYFFRELTLKEAKEYFNQIPGKQLSRYFVRFKEENKYYPVYTGALFCPEIRVNRDFKWFMKLTKPQISRLIAEANEDNQSKEIEIFDF